MVNGYVKNLGLFTMFLIAADYDEKIGLVGMSLLSTKLVMS